MDRRARVRHAGLMAAAAASRPGLHRLVAAALVLAGAVAARAAEVGGVSLPDTVTQDGRTLVLNGAGVRTRAMLLRVYAMGLYLPARVARADAIDGAGPWRVEMHALRALTGEQIGDAIRDGFARNSGERLPALQARLDQLTQLFPAVRAGNVILLAHEPGRGTRVALDGRELGVIAGEDFATALLAVWLGPRPVDETLKAALLGG